MDTPNDISNDCDNLISYHVLFIRTGRIYIYTIVDCAFKHLHSIFYNQSLSLVRGLLKILSLEKQKYGTLPWYFEPL